MYLLCAYGKRYQCDAVALVYPRSGRFPSELRYRFFDGLPLICLPFDVTNPKGSVELSLRSLEGFAGHRILRRMVFPIRGGPSNRRVSMIQGTGP